MHEVKHTGLPDLSPTMKQRRLYRLLNDFGPRAPNATRTLIVDTLNSILDALKEAGQTQPDALSIAVIASQLGETALARKALDVCPDAGGPGFEKRLRWMCGDIDGLRSMLSLPNIDRFLRSDILQLIADLELQRNERDAALSAARQAESAAGHADALVWLTWIYEDAGDRPRAISSLREEAERLTEMPSPGVYSLAMMAARCSYLGEQDAAVSLCRRGYDIYKAGAPSTYPGHYYLAFAAEWANAPGIYDEIFGKLRPEEIKTFWIWHLILATELSFPVPSDKTVIEKTGLTFADRLIRRAITMDRRADAVTLMEQALESESDLFSLRKLACYAICLGRADLAARALGKASGIAAGMAMDFTGIEARLNVALWKRRASRGELAEILRVPHPCFFG
jgi:hypothetical protein